MVVDVLIVGQGICGTFLSYYLQDAGQRALVIDNNDFFSPSRVAAGIINPITGRRLVKVWMAEKILSFAHDAYRSMGKLLNIDCVEQKNIIDFFPNVHQRQVFIERVSESEEYLRSFPEQNKFNSFFNYELGCGEIAHSYLAKLEVLLPAWRNELKNNACLLDENFELNNLSVTQDGIHYNDITAKTIIFCDGLNSFNNPYFRVLPFAPNKGEMLLVEIPDLPTEHIYKRAFMLVPMAQRNLFWFGSNYQWSFENANITAEFYEQAKRHLTAWLRVPFKIVDHKASVRPATLERRPFVGFHPIQKNIGLLNGMGTKGCSLAPFFAKELADHIVQGTPITANADIKRFSKILSG